MKTSNVYKCHTYFILLKHMFLINYILYGNYRLKSVYSFIFM